MNAKTCSLVMRVLGNVKRCLNNVDRFSLTASKFKKNYLSFDINNVVYGVNCIFVRIDILNIGYCGDCSGNLKYTTRHKL